MTSGEEHDPIGSLTRRKAVAAGASAAGLSGIAGCAGGQRTQAGVITDEGGNVVLHSSVPWSFSVEDLAVANWGPAPSPTGQRRVFFPPMLAYDPIKKQYFPEVSPDFPEMDGCVMRVPVREDTYYWWNGDVVRPEDRIYGHQLATYMAHGGPDAVPWEARFDPDSEWAWLETKVGNMNVAFRKENMSRPAIRWRRDVFKPFWEEMQDASTSEEVQRITSDVRQLRLGIDWMMEKGYGFGLWKPVAYASDSITFEQWEKHPQYGQSDIDRWKWHVISNEQSRFQAIEQGLLDSSTIDLGGSNRIRAPEGFGEVYSFPSLSGLKLDISWRHQHLADKWVRRAINYLMHKEALADLISGAGAEPLTQMTGGFPDAVVERVLGAEFLDQLIDYGVERDRENAREMMRRGGYEQPNDQWIGPDGNPVEDITFISTAGATDALVASTISGLLSQFGIENKLLTLEGTTFYSRVNEDYDFDLALTYTNKRSPAPHALWNVHGISDFANVSDTSAPETCDPGLPTYEYTNPRTKKHKIPLDPVPEYPGLDNLGALTLDEGSESFSPMHNSLAMRLQYPEERITQWAREYAWWVNYHAVNVYLFTYKQTQWLDTDTFAIREGAPIFGVGPGQNPMRTGNVVTRRSIDSE
jgi:hypothetical protein